MVDRTLATALRAVLNAPHPLLRRLAGPEKRNERGEVLDLQTQALLRLTELLRFPKAYEQTPVQARAGFERQAKLVDPSPPATEVEDRRCDGPGGQLALRIYRSGANGRPRPLIVYFHGGGYVVGSIDSHDAVCRRLAYGSDCVVVSVDFRRGPEDPFPAAVEDGMAAFGWVVENARALGGDPQRVGVAGDSAGAGLAAVVSHLQRDADRPLPAFQVLVYPAADQTRSMPSHDRFAQGYFLDRALKDWFVANYLGDSGRERDPRASPLFSERFDGLPPALVVSAGFDPLRDEDEAYAAALRDAGVPVEELYEPSLIHGFLSMQMLDAPRAAGDRIAAGLARLAA